MPALPGPEQTQAGRLQVQSQPGQLRLSQNTVEKRGGGSCKCVSVIDNSCNIVRPRVQSPTPQSIYLKYTTNILICIYSVRQFY